MRRSLEEFGLTSSLIERALAELEPRDLERWLVAVRDGFVRARTPVAVLAQAIRSALAGEPWALPEHFDRWRRERARAQRVEAEQQARVRAEAPRLEAAERVRLERWKRLTVPERIDQVVREGLEAVRRHVALLVDAARLDERAFRALLERELAPAIAADRPPDLHTLSRSVVHSVKSSGERRRRMSRVLSVQKVPLSECDTPDFRGNEDVVAEDLRAFRAESAATGSARFVELEAPRSAGSVVDESSTRLRDVRSEPR